MKSIRYNLWKMKRSLAPRGIFAKALQQKLDSAWVSRYGSIPWYQAHILRLASAGTIGVLMAGSFGTGAYAYVSPEVTEESILYPVKQKIEAVEERILNRTPEAKAKFYFKQIARREAESAVLAAHGRPLEQLEERVEKAEEKLAAVRAKLTALASKQSLELQAKIQTRLALRRERLERQAARLALQLEKAAEVNDDEANPREQARATALVSTTIAGEQAVRRAKRQEKIVARLRLVQERIDQLPRTSTPAAFPNSSSSPGLLMPIQRIEKIKERFERRIDQLDNKLDKRAEKLEEREKLRVLPAPARNTMLQATTTVKIGL